MSFIMRQLSGYSCQDWFWTYIFKKAMKQYNYLLKT